MSGSEPRPVSTETVRKRLRDVIDPCSAAAGTDLDIVEMGLVDEVTVERGTATVSMRLTSPGCMMVEYFARRVDEVLEPVDGIRSVTLETDAGFDWHRGLMHETAREKRAARRRDLRMQYGDELSHKPAGAPVSGASDVKEAARSSPATADPRPDGGDEDGD